MLTERRAGRNGKYWALQRGLRNQLCCAVAACAVAAARIEVLVDYGLRRLFAPSAATSDWQLVLHVKQGACTAIDTLADVFIGNGMAHADVHQSPSVTVRPDISLR
jgi:hypothetical protein